MSVFIWCADPSFFYETCSEPWFKLARNCRNPPSLYGGKPACDEIQQKLKDKISEIDRQIEQLLTLQGELRGLFSGWDTLATKPEDTICPIIQKD